MEAFELFDAIDLRHTCPPLILVTEARDKGMLARAERSGVTAVLQRPQDADDFLEQVQRIARDGPVCG
jgi:AmiR/NasT family two-component response regulator